MSLDPPPEVVPVRRVLAATDRSRSADAAVRWAADMANGQGADLILVQVLPAEPGTIEEGEGAPVAGVDLVHIELARLASDLAGDRGSSIVVVDDDPTRAILAAIEEQRADTVVLGNIGMAGRKQFLLGNVPNRVSHNARCNVVIVNTSPPGGATAYRSVLQRNEDSGPPPLTGRAMRIGRVLVKAGVQELLQRRRGDPAEHEASARRLRVALEELGPTFAKLGQMLSTRPDLIPPAFVDELANLREQVTTLPEADVVGVIEEELGVPWEDVFESMEFEPLAGGTIAQVHRATLEGGERVVVKVQRPTAAEDIDQDLALLQIFARKTGERPGLNRAFDLPSIVAELSASLRRELDFREEADNIERLRTALEPYPRLDVPAVYAELSSRRLLVMEEVQGTPIEQAPLGEERREAARQLLESYYSQIMTEGFFHADPHSGNLKWWRERIYFLDLGMIGEVDETARELMLLLLLAVWQEDSRFLSEVVLMLSGTEQPHTDDIDLASFENELSEIVERYRNQPLREIQLGPMMQEVTSIAVRHGVRLPPSLTLVAKALAQMQLAAGELDPTLDPLSVAGSFVLRSTLRQLTGGLNPQKMFYETRKLSVRLVRMLEAVEGMIGARPGSRLQVNFRGTERLEQTMADASRRLSLALGFSAAVVGAAMTANTPRVGRWAPGLLGGVASALGAGLMIDLLRRRR